jgi:acylphosphatase
VLPGLAALLESAACGGAPERAVHEDKVARRYYVSGMVQGVGYRYFASRVARQLGVAGFAKNLRDGRVEVYAIAPPAALKAFRSELRRGPQGAIVDDVSEDEAEIDPQFADRFSIAYDD